MKVYGLSEAAVKKAVGAVSKSAYAGNLYAANTRDASTRSEDRATFVIRCHSSREEGARLSPSGRRTVAASWGAHRDVIAYLFESGATRVKSMVADYTSMKDFEREYPATYYHVVGSMMNPSQLGDL